MALEWLKMLACPMPKGLLAFVAAAVVGYVRWYADMSPSYDYRFFSLAAGRRCWLCAAWVSPADAFLRGVSFRFSGMK